jgi:thiamine biosynthesis lipoprotein
MNRLAWSLVVVGCMGAVGVAGETEATFAGPAMGTTYRVTLARGVPGMTRGEVHREVEAVLVRIDRALSSWREDSDASRLNRAAADEWVEVAPELVEAVELARRIHEASADAFDITAAPLLRLHRGSPSDADVARALERVGMRHLESRASPPAIRKRMAGVEIDLGGIGPGYAVDEIGARLTALGSTDHLVELGGEVRAWGLRPDGGKWRVRLRHGAASGPERHVIELAAGEAVATSTARPGRSPVDPRTGRVVAGALGSATVRGSSCAMADAWAVAALVLDLPAAADGTVPISPAPSRPAAPPGARPKAP